MTNENRGPDQGTQRGRTGGPSVAGCPHAAVPAPRRFSAPSPTPGPHPWQAGPGRGPVDPFARLPAPPPADTAALEERLVGRWFPRLGALAVMAGAGFGVAYAVQRGWNAPLARVLAIAALGGVAIVISEQARGRDWTAPAQALAAAGIALLYLAVWSSSRIYGLVPLPVALAMLSAVAVGAAVLAIVHDSELLALLALGAGFLNPFTTEAVAGPSALAYFAVIAAGAVVLAEIGRA